jgi:hypothetical protein
MSSLINADVVPEGEAGEPPSPELLQRYPSMDPRTGEFGPLQRRVPRHPPAPGYVHPDRLAAHQEALRQVRDEHARLMGRYPTMAGQKAGMAPVPPDPKLVQRYAASMPGGSAERPTPPAAPAPAAKPAPAPAQPTQPAAATNETQDSAAERPLSEARQPEVAAPALPAEYADLAIEGFAVDHAALARVAPALEDLAIDRQQAEGLVKVYADLQQQEHQALADEQARWRATAERSLTEADHAGIKAAMADAPQALKDWLNASGVGDYPPLVKHLARLGRKLAAAQAPAERLAARYPTMSGKDWR